MEHGTTEHGSTEHGSTGAQEHGAQEHGAREHGAQEHGSTCHAFLEKRERVSCFPKKKKRAPAAETSTQTPLLFQVMFFREKQRPLLGTLIRDDFFVMNMLRSFWGNFGVVLGPLFFSEKHDLEKQWCLG
jgi:hypothetical protein